MAHVKFIVLPAPTYRSGPPSIVAVGTVIKNDFLFFHSRYFPRSFRSLILSLLHYAYAIRTFTSRGNYSRESDLSETIFTEPRARGYFTDSRDLTSQSFSSKAKVIVIEITRPASVVSYSPKLGSKVSPPATLIHLDH